MYRDTYCCPHYIAAAGHPHIMHRVHSNFVPRAVWKSRLEHTHGFDQAKSRNQFWASSRWSCMAPPRRIEPALPRQTLPPADVSAMHTISSHHRLSHLLSGDLRIISPGNLMPITNHRSSTFTGTWTEHHPVFVSRILSEG